MRVDSSIQVHAPVREVYDQWTQFEEFPRFMEGIKQVQQLDDDRLRWQAEVAGETKEWLARITRQIPDQLVAWQSESGALNSGEVVFHPITEGETQVDLHMSYEPGDLLEQLGGGAGMPSRLIEDDLNRFKRFIESRGAATGSWRGETDNNGSSSRNEPAARPSPQQEAVRSNPGGDARPSGRSAADVGMTGRSDVEREGLRNDEPGGRGALAYGGRGDVGRGGGLGGEGRGAEDGPLNEAGGGTGGEGRGLESVFHGGAEPSSAARSAAEDAGAPSQAPLTPRRGPVPDVARNAGDVSMAGGAGALGSEDALAGKGIRDQGGAGRESQSTGGGEWRENETGPVGTDRPADSLRSGDTGEQGAGRDWTRNAAEDSADDDPEGDRTG